MKARHASKVDFVPFSGLSWENNGVGIDDPYGHFFVSTVNSMFCNARIFDCAWHTTFRKDDNGSNLSIFPSLVYLEVAYSSKTVDTTFGPG